MKDRRKHLAIQKQHPELDIRFVFSNAQAKLYKGSKTRYSGWCEKITSSGRIELYLWTG